MKKAVYFVLATIGVVTLASCTKFEDTAPPRKITFEKGIYRPQTKAESSVMDEFTSFKCKAFLHAEGYESDTQDMFGESGETIYAYDSSDAITTTSANVAYWAPSHDYYWPKGATSYINFVAWYDSKATAPTAATETSLSWNGYTVGASDNLLFADEAWRYKATPDATYHKDGSVTKGVPMLFHHALAQLCIKANVSIAEKDNKTGKDETVNAGKKTTWDVTLSDISLSGVYEKGNLTLTNSDPKNDSPSVEDPSTKAWSGFWTPVAPTTSFDMTAPASPLTTDADDNVLLAMRTVLPQDVAGNDDLILSFKYNISTKFGGVEYAHETISASIPLKGITEVTAWEMNKKITYTITINPETTLIYIDPAKEDWITDGTNTSGSANL